MFKKITWNYFHAPPPPSFNPQICKIKVSESSQEIRDKFFLKFFRSETIWNFSEPPVPPILQPKNWILKT